MVGFNVFIKFEANHGGDLFLKMSEITSVEGKKVINDYCQITMRDGSKYIVKGEAEKVVCRVADEILRPKSTIESSSVH